MGLRKYGWISCAAWLCVACGASGHSATVPPTLEMGTGTEAFETVTDREHLMLYPGTQGGHHVWLSYRVKGLSPDGIRMELDVVPVAPARPAHTDVILDLTKVKDDADTYEFLGWTAQVLDPECAVGKEVSLALKVTDTEGRSVMGSMVVIADPPEAGFTRSCNR